MQVPSSKSNGGASAPTPGGEIRDRRVPPRGVLPRQLQMWLMVIIAVVIVGIILMTGQRQAPWPPDGVDRLTEPQPVPADRIRQFEQQLGDDELRLLQLAERAAESPPRTSPAAVGSRTSASSVGAVQQPPDDLSLFADNVAFSQREGRPQSSGVGSYPSSPGTGTELPVPSPEEIAQFEQELLAIMASAGNPAPAPSSPVIPSLPAAPPSPLALAEPASQPIEPPAPAAPTVDGRFRLLEGTVIESVLLNRLDGTFAGPVACLVTTPVYASVGPQLLIPAGARLLGSASAVQGWGDSRLAVSFHRLVMPNGQTYSLELFKGLTQAGETGLKDQVDRHYWQVFGASLAIGALSGLAQYNTRSGVDAGFGDAYRQSAGASLASSTGRILDRYLNILPTVTIREGYRIKVYLTNDLDLPSYVQPSGGV